MNWHAVGVFFAGIGIGYAVLQSTYQPQHMMNTQQMQQMMNDPQHMQKMSDMMRNNPQMLQHMVNLMNDTMMGSNMTGHMMYP